MATFVANLDPCYDWATYHDRLLNALNLESDVLEDRLDEECQLDSIGQMFWAEVQQTSMASRHRYHISIWEQRHEAHIQAVCRSWRSAALHSTANMKENSVVIYNTPRFARCTCEDKERLFTVQELDSAELVLAYLARPTNPAVRNNIRSFRNELLRQTWCTDCGSYSNGVHAWTHAVLNIPQQESLTHSLMTNWAPSCLANFELATDRKGRTIY